MRHYAAVVQCPRCGFKFSTCLHAPLPPTPRDRYVVLYPGNRSRVTVTGAALSGVAVCPAGAVIIKP